MASGDGDRSADVQCTVTVEQLSSGGRSPRRRLLRNASVVLGRNELRQLVLRIGDGPRPLSFVLGRIRLFTRFLRDGKSSIQLLPDCTQLLLSNCPPERLKGFMRTLWLKHRASEPLPAAITERTRLVACLPRTFQTISPVQLRDMERAAPETPTSRRQRAPAKRGRTVSSEKSLTDLKPLKKPALSMPSRAKLSAEQSVILRAVLDGKSVFFTGSAGTGKSYLLKKIVGSLPPESTFATASTGVAACHIGGTTLHSFAGIGSGKAPLDQCIDLANRPGVRQQWLTCQHLIIDEISMVEGEYFDKLEAVARAVRRRDDPFGGIHLIICGDFLQLPPVVKVNEEAKFCFQAKSWKQCIQLNMELTEVRRQTDKTFISLLQAIRLGRCPEEVASQLMMTATNKIERDGILATRLCTHKDDVELTNERRLQQLPGEMHSYEALDSDPLLVKAIDVQSPVAQVIQLKKGAQVMLTRNLNVSRSLVNGARGVVVGFEPEGKGFPRVRFLCGVTEVIKPECWTFKAHGGGILSRKQLPLKLAWAISIHKSQGMSLDCVEISLARVFECGQAYVALSRAQSLQGLRVMDFDAKAVRANPNVLQFYSRLKKECV